MNYWDIHIYKEKRFLNDTSNANYNYTAWTKLAIESKTPFNFRSRVAYKSYNSITFLTSRKVETVNCLEVKRPICRTSIQFQVSIQSNPRTMIGLDTNILSMPIRVLSSLLNELVDVF